MAGQAEMMFNQLHHLFFSSMSFHDPPTPHYQTLPQAIIPFILLQIPASEKDRAPKVLLLKMPQQLSAADMAKFTNIALQQFSNKAHENKKDRSR